MLFIWLDLKFVSFFQDARRLWRAGEARLGTDEAAFNAILAAQNYAQLRLVFNKQQQQENEI